MAKKALARYRAKRNFAVTTEPSGAGRVAPSARRRFVIQKHAARRLHYDLRLELDGIFKSWAVTRGPSLDPGQKRLAVEVEDHPLEYGDFEGTIPAGEYGGGTVQLWDRGTWMPEGEGSPAKALAGGELKFTLDGERLHGSWVLVRLRQDRNGGKRTNWLLIKHRDDAARPGDAETILAEDRSVASGRTLAQITAGKGKAPRPFMLAGAATARSDAVWHGAARRAPPEPAAPASVAALPEFVAPQLCTLVDRPPSGAGWAHEVKYDGYRMQLRVAHGRATLRTRKGLDWSARFSSLVEAARALPDALLDGEVVALDSDRIPSFSGLQDALSKGRSEGLIFFAFDLLGEGHTDLRSVPLAGRKLRLKALLAAHPREELRYAEHFESSGEDVWSSACRMKLEGIVSKRLDAPYASGRSTTWTKAKCRAGQDVVLGGWTTGAGTVRSLLAGVYRDGRLAYVGRIGTGFGAAVTASLLPRLKALTRKTSPFDPATSPAPAANVRWLKPNLVAEIQFAGWTGTGMIRQASFKGLREDQPPGDVHAERHAEPAAPQGAEPAKPRAGVGRVPERGGGNGEAAVLGVSITHAGKVLWPDAGDGRPVCKIDLARYFEAVAPWMLPHLAGRPCSLLRAPEGIAGEHFFQRHATPGLSPAFELVRLRGDRAPYVEIARAEGLVAAAQMGTLELHPWNCVPGKPELAGRLVFDLDPAPDVNFEAVIAAALEVRERLQALGLTAFCKTTGGKGLHVVTPLSAGKGVQAWPEAKNFAHLLCAQMAADSPSRYLDTMSKKARTGRIFLDYLRNDRLATAVAPLSPRAREGATVSMPIPWAAVRPGLDPKAFTIRTATASLRRLKPWSDYAGSAGSLRDAIRAATRKAGRNPH